MPIITLDGRIKRLYSIHLKLKRQKIDLERVYDFVALRVITQSVKDCYAALGIIHQTWSPVPGRIKDFIAMPRPNGYQSLHTSVISEHGFPFEVQIRTEEMHRRAEEGIAAHWKYKEGRVGDHRDERYFQWMRQLLEVQQEVRDPQEFLQNLKIDLYPEEVYIFTPKGEVRSLPRGATAVDFAYSVHTDVGNQCVGARINGRMVPLRTRLQNGDIVEIVTQTGHKPSRDWLSFVVTSRARSKIKHVLQAEERTRSIELGRRLFDKEARRFGLNPGDVARERRSWRSSRRSTARSRPRSCSRTSATASCRRARCCRSRRRTDSSRRRRRIVVVSVVKRVLRPGSASDKIKVRGTDDVMVFRAKCCNPIRGERIVGYITRGKGVSVHSLGCPNVLNLMFDPERRIDVEWDSAGTDQAPYVVRLTMQVEDRKGMLAEISARVSDINTNITNMEARTRRRSAGPHRHDGRDPRREAPREGDQVDQGRAGRAGGGANCASVIQNAEFRMQTMHVCILHSALREHSDRVDFDLHVARQPRDLHGRSRRRRSRNVPAVDLVHRREVVHVREEHRRSDDVLEAGTGRAQQRAEVAHHLLGLRGDVAVDERAGCRIDRDLARHEEQIARL